MPNANKLYFEVLPTEASLPTKARSKAFLIEDDWNDWFKYNTLFSLVVFDKDGERHSIGWVKIGQFNMKEGKRRVSLSEVFNSLDDRYFSLGQDDSYYNALNRLGPKIRNRVLRGLRDMAFDLNLFEQARGEKVTGISLLRSVTPATVKGQFHRMAHGGARLSEYEFRYTAPREAGTHADPVTLSFMVEPESQPPTNIHVLIGRNGVGKTRLLNHMTRALVEDGASAADVGTFESETEDPLGSRLFASIVSVTFSAFDSFTPPPNLQNRSEGVQYAYIGLKRRGMTTDRKPLAPRTPDRLSSDFSNSVWMCRQGARVGRWHRALKMLETDPIFRDEEVAELADKQISKEELKERARRLFGNLSSGHKIVLLTITRLVETVEERTLVLLDEPEAHLHPPLLSAFVRALSELLIDRNGVAIIATHSPVVLQEVPRSCAWKIRRNHLKVEAERPEIETFGENVGILTREVFGLEVTHSGFHKMLRDAVSEGEDFDRIVKRFNDELGGEARAIVRALIAARAAGDDL